MKRVITISIEGEPSGELKPSGDRELERMWYLRALGGPARQAVEDFQHVKLGNTLTQMEVSE